MRALIVDDIELARKRVVRLLSNHNIQSLEASCVDEALHLLKSNSFDVVFLDISMPQIDGFEVAKYLKDKNTPIVFVTAYDEYAIKGYEYNTIGYILKPIKDSDIQNILSKLNTQNQIQKYTTFLCKEAKKLYPIKPQDIIYLKADLNEVIVRTKDKYLYLSKNISEIETSLDKDFFKIHRSYIINLSKIKSMENDIQSKYIIYFYEIDETITTSKDGAKRLREYFGI